MRRKAFRWFLYPLLNNHGFADNSGDGGDGDGDGDNGDGDEKVADLQTIVKGLKGDMETLKGAKEDLERKLHAADSELLGPKYLEFLEGKKGEGTPASTKTEDDIDLSTLSGKEMVEYITGKRDATVKEFGKAIDEKFKTLDSRLTSAFAQLDLELTTLKHSDLDLSNKDYKTHFYNVAKENPTWGAEKVYKQVKQEVKATAEEAEEADKVKAKRELDAVAEKGGVSSSTVTGKQLSAKEAVDLAFKKTMGTKE